MNLYPILDTVSTALLVLTSICYFYQVIYLILPLLLELRASLPPGGRCPSAHTGADGGWRAVPTCSRSDRCTTRQITARCPHQSRSARQLMNSGAIATGNRLF